MDKRRTKLTVVSIWILLLISTCIAWTVNRPRGYGASHSEMLAGEIQITEFNMWTLSGEIQRISYDALEGTIEIYVVAQDSYNITSHEVPETYLLYHTGNSTTLNLNGPLPRLYYIVVSEVDQYVYVQSWVFSSKAIQAQMLVYPLAVLTGAVSIFGMGWYLVSRKPVKGTNGESGGI